MKIKTDNDFFIFPDRGIHLLIAEEYAGQIIECFSLYFNQKKKTKCMILDQDNEMIDFKEASFIYISKDEQIDQWFEFKPKTLLNNEFSELMLKNEKMFGSLQMIRDDMKELLTDQGVYELYRILGKDLSVHLKMQSSNFDIPKLLQMFSMDVEELTASKKFMILYNLLLFINRDKFRIVYMDFELDHDVYRWLSKKKDNNTLILIDNEAVIAESEPVFDSAIIMSNSNHIQEMEIGLEQVDLISYLFHPVVRKNTRFLTEKNYNLLRNFDDEKSTFFINLTADNPSISL